MEIVVATAQRQRRANRCQSGQRSINLIVNLTTEIAQVENIAREANEVVAGRLGNQPVEPSSVGVEIRDM